MQLLSTFVTHINEYEEVRFVLARPGLPAA